MWTVVLYMFPNTARVWPGRQPGQTECDATDPEEVGVRFTPSKPFNQSDLVLQSEEVAGVAVCVAALRITGMQGCTRQAAAQARRPSPAGTRHCPDK